MFQQRRDRFVRLAPSLGGHVRAVQRGSGLSHCSFVTAFLPRVLELLTPFVVMERLGETACRTADPTSPWPGRYRAWLSPQRWRVELRLERLRDHWAERT